LKQFPVISRERCAAPVLPTEISEVTVSSGNAYREIFQPMRGSSLRRSASNVKIGVRPVQPATCWKYCWERDDRHRGKIFFSDAFCPCRTIGHPSESLSGAPRYDRLISIFVFFPPLIMCCSATTEPELDECVSNCASLTESRPPNTPFRAREDFRVVLNRRAKRRVERRKPRGVSFSLPRTVGRLNRKRTNRSQTADRQLGARISFVSGSV